MLAPTHTVSRSWSAGAARAGAAGAAGGWGGWELPQLNTQARRLTSGKRARAWAPRSQQGPHATRCPGAACGKRAPPAEGPSRLLCASVGAAGPAAVAGLRLGRACASPLAGLALAPSARATRILATAAQRWASARARGQCGAAPEAWAALTARFERGAAQRADRAGARAPRAFEGLSGAFAAARAAGRGRARAARASFAGGSPGARVDYGDGLTGPPRALRPDAGCQTAPFGSITLHGIAGPRVGPAPGACGGM